MGESVIIADVMTLARLAATGALSAAERLDVSVTVLDWLRLSPSLKSICERYHVEPVSLTDSEVEETFCLYQRIAAHGVGIAQYGALVFAKNNGAFFASCDALTLNMGRVLGLLNPESANSLSGFFPQLETYRVYNELETDI